jgi:replicative DNA helicase
VSADRIQAAAPDPWLAQIADVAAEAALLGAALLAPRSAARVLTNLFERDFTDPRHRLVFSAIVGCLRRGVPPDPVTVLEEARARGFLAGGYSPDRNAGALLHDLVQGCPLPSSAAHYARVVLDRSARRRALEAAERIRQAATHSQLEDLAAVVHQEAEAARRAADRAQLPMRVHLAVVDEGTG